MPDIIETGIDVLNPLEVKAGMDAAKVKKTYGKKLVLHGGINAALFGDRDAVMAEVNEKLPILAEGEDTSSRRIIRSRTVRHRKLSVVSRTP